MSSKSKNKWILAVHNDGVLSPYASYDREMFAALPCGVPLRIQVAQARSQPRHRLYRVILRLVVNNSDRFASEESLHETLLVGCGVVKPVVTVAGEIIMIPSSTAFDKMEEDEFKAYFDQAMEIIQTHIIPGIDLKLLLREARMMSKYTEKEAA